MNAYLSIASRDSAALTNGSSLSTSLDSGQAHNVPASSLATQGSPLWLWLLLILIVAGAGYLYYSLGNKKNEYSY